MKRGFKIFVIILTVGLLLGISGVLYVFNMPHRNINLEYPAYTVEANSLYFEFTTNELLANKTYINQVIQVTGDIAELFMDGCHVSIVLNDNVEGVSCELDSLTIIKNKSIIETLKVGDPITLKGKCDGFDKIMGVVLTRCFIID